MIVKKIYKLYLSIIKFWSSITLCSIFTISSVGVSVHSTIFTVGSSLIAPPQNLDTQNGMETNTTVTSNSSVSGSSTIFTVSSNNLDPELKIFNYKECVDFVNP